MKGILGRKVGMTQIFDSEGKVIPVTLVEAGPCVVAALRTPEKDGYSAVVLGYGDVKPNKVNRPMRASFKKAGVEPKRWLREFRINEPVDVQVGSEVTVGSFQEGEVVDVTGVSKGKGFAGVMKRYGFGGGPASHGSSKFHRQPGSSSANTSPGHVFKGKRMPGRMGGRRVTVKNISVAAVDEENNLLILKGAVPGSRNGLLLIHKKS